MSYPEYPPVQLLPFFEWMPNPDIPYRPLDNRQETQHVQSMVWEKTSVASSGLNFGRFLCHQDILKNILLVIVYNRGNMLPKLRIDCNTDALRQAI